MSPTFREVFQQATGRQPFPYQVALAEAPTLPRLLRAPTGSGKTAAAVLGWLYRRRFHPDQQVRTATPRRLVYCLPLRSLVEQASAAAEEWLGALGLRTDFRVHRLLGGEVDRDWVRRPDADAVLVGTMDMLLSRALNRGFAATRYRWPIEFGLLNNDCLWVLDEVQLMGNGLVTSAQLEGLREAFGLFRPCQSLWMSATVAASWIAGPDFGPVRPDETLELGESDRSFPDLAARLQARKTLRSLGQTFSRQWASALSAIVLEAHRPGTRTLVVLNTVDRAVELYRQLARRGPSARLVLLHSRFRPVERAGQLAELLDPPDGAGTICVSTQVVEAGIDVSAATLFTEVAPWASLVQRFGRCNRFGEYPEASITWIDGLAPAPDPYDEAELDRARQILTGLHGEQVGPARLEALPRGDPPISTHVPRRTDILDLFDTEPDLSGNDVDVSRFIRDDADVDCHVAWRPLNGSAPSVDMPRPRLEELCPVQPSRLRALLKRLDGRQAYVWDHLRREWRVARSEDVRPGVLVIVDAAAGGYDTLLGFDPSSSRPVPLVAIPGQPESPPEEGFDDEQRAEADGAWVGIGRHGLETTETLRQLIARIAPDLARWPWIEDAAAMAALWHDVGKAHRVFQEALIGEPATAPPQGVDVGPWAKAPAGLRRYERPHFRHELASALALLQTAGALPALQVCPEEDRALMRDLAAYLVAAHHGKIRLAIRSLPGEKRPPATESGELAPFARGIWQDDELPAVALDGFTMPPLRLDLSVMAIGRSGEEESWLERTLRLLDLLGPFRLAYLEAIVRVADWAASEMHGGGHG